jgi:hypothetical protein
MILRFAFLANSAEVGPDGRFYVIGGGIDSLGVPSIPLAFPALALLLELYFEPEECGRRFEISLTLTLPDGSDAGVQLKTSGSPEPSKSFNQPGSIVHVVFSFYSLALTQVGDHRFNILVDGRPIGHHVVAVGIMDPQIEGELRRANSDAS